MEAARKSANQMRGASNRTTVLGEALAVLRLAFTLRLDASRLVGRDITIAWLGAAALGVWILLDWFRFDEPVRLDPIGLPGVAACAAMALACAWLLARASVPPLPVRSTLWLVAGYLPAAVVAAWVLRAPISRTTFNIVAIVFALHAALYFYFGLMALSGAVPRRAFGAWLGAVAGMVALGQVVPVQTGLWTVHRTAEQIDDHMESARRTEELLYAQADRIDAAVMAMAAPSEPGPDIYFLGFAGFGEQPVFANEIALAADRVDERYGIGNRRILLVNDRRDYDRHPLASPSALSRAINGIAARMDREHDVLFLAFASHGREDPHLVITNGALPLEKLTAESLARTLQESRIRWKVLVISACYAGAFIEHLRDEHTVIITAAAPDKMSFGCNDKRQLTYFGEAFYRDALPGAASLRAAFDAAVARVAAREHAEGLVPSQPRAHFGVATERKLARLEAPVR
jgi:Peptidase C13 family